MVPGPPQPNLSLLAWGTGKAKESLRTPEKLLKTWHDHSVHGAEFREFLEKARQDYSLDVKISSNGDEPAQEPPLKKQRVTGAGNGTLNKSTFELKVVEEVPAALCWQAKVTGSPKINLIVTVGHGVFARNSSSDVVVVKAGTTLAGYYKGRFWMPDGKGGEDQTPQDTCDVPFKLQSDQDKVMMNGKFSSLFEIIMAKRELTPADATVSYHELQDAPTATSASAFALKPKGSSALYFKVQDFPARSEVKTEADDEQKLMIPAAHLAGAVPVSVWEKCQAARLIWAVKWPAVASKGLQPIRPMLVALYDLKIEGNQIVELVPPS